MKFEKPAFGIKPLKVECPYVANSICKDSFPYGGIPGDDIDVPH
jgi:hypothetical protein